MSEVRKLKDRIEFMKCLERGLEVRKSTKTLWTVTGHKYITLTSGGIKEEGDRVPAFYATTDLAEDAFINVFEDYTENKKELYWRRLPALESISIVDQRDWYYVSCRVFAR